MILDKFEVGKTYKVTYMAFYQSKTDKGFIKKKKLKLIQKTDRLLVFSDKHGKVCVSKSDLITRNAVVVWIENKDENLE